MERILIRFKNISTFSSETKRDNFMVQMKLYGFNVILCYHMMNILSCHLIFSLK
jgi:hypothetical protein